MFTPSSRVQVLNPALRQKKYLPSSHVRYALGAARDVAMGRGAVFDVADPDDVDDDDDDGDAAGGGAAAGDPDDAAGAVTDWWPQVARLKWTLRSDGEVSLPELVATVGQMRREGVFAGLARFVRTQVAVLRSVPFHAALPEPSLVQFVALGAEWCAILMDAPVQADFLSTELQDVDLHARVGG